jgi:hypothetical protein
MDSLIKTVIFMVKEVDYQRGAKNYYNLMKSQDKNIPKKQDDFNKKTGEILVIFGNVENSLDKFISKYFCSPQDLRANSLTEIVFNDFRFADKIHIFKEICKKEKIDYSNIDKDLERINKIRNKVAHWWPHFFYKNGEYEVVRTDKRFSKFMEHKFLKIVDKIDKEGSVEKLDERHEAEIISIDGFNDLSWKTINRIDELRRKHFDFERRIKETEDLIKYMKKEKKYWNTMGL